MRSALLALALTATACGSAGIPPELYALVLDTVTIPASCFAVAPTGTLGKGPLGTTQVEVFDTVDSKAFMLPDTALSFDMGDAPNVAVSSGEALEGTSGATGWTFVADRDVTSVNGVGGITQTVQTKTHLSVLIERTKTAKGALSISSSRTCTGTGCGANTSCTIDSIPFRSTRLAVDFERSP